MKCIIPCAGYGTRLGELGNQVPKSLIKIRGRPVIEYILDKVSQLPVDKVWIISNAKFHDQFEKWLKDFKSPVKLELINDGSTSNENRLGTLKDIKLALNQFDDDFFVVFGDSYFNFDLRLAAEKFIKKQQPLLVLYDLADYEVAKRHGIVTLNDNNKILTIVEKPANPQTTICTAGMYFLTKKDKAFIEQYLQEGKNPEGITYFLQELHKKRDIWGYVYKNKDDTYLDIGVHQALEQANNSKF